MKFGSLLADPAMKLLALAIALIFWTVESAPRRERPVERPFEVQLSLMGIPRDLIVTTTVQDRVNVWLRGRPSVLQQLSSANLEATLDLSGNRPGPLSVPIRPESLNLPQDVEVVTIDPAVVSLTLEQRRGGVVPIRPFTVGELPPGYQIGEITVTPDRAELTGPASFIKNVDEVATERIILSGRIATFQTTVGLVSDHPLVRITQPASVVVTVTIIPPPPVEAEPVEGEAEELPEETPP